MLKPRNSHTFIAACVFAISSSVLAQSGNSDRCEVGIANLQTQKSLMLGSFKTLIAEEELTTKAFRLPQTNLFIVASVFYTDESLSSEKGADSISLELVLSSSRKRNLLRSRGWAEAEIPLNGFDVGRVTMMIKARGHPELVVMECRKDVRRWIIDGYTEHSLAVDSPGAGFFVTLRGEPLKRNVMWLPSLANENYVSNWSEIGSDSKAFKALRDQALNYLPLGSTIDADNNVLIGHAPQVGSEAYLFTLFPPAQEAWFENFKQRERKEIPTLYRALLSVTNGYLCFDLSLFGLAPSMQDSVPLLDRAKRQCHDLSLAHRDWIHEFEVEENWFILAVELWVQARMLVTFWTKTL